MSFVPVSEFALVFVQYVRGGRRGGGGSKYQVNNDHEIVRVMSYIVPGVLNLLGKCTE